ncbi:RHS repeat-associated core domain-containing protein [Pseudoteredinibacter isoporae]|uniref:RHS repeat-associated core domain-containing protein n=1 Tax=Pseudoteredinibacter isoporae TaxID=570281 RepID=UPI001C878DAC|nr:RHS repeat-associated core domain-containing protein [Pseudoteredinibacter isoporae]
MSNSVGAITDTYGYNAFGEVLFRTGSTENRYTFTGEQYDPTLGQFYLRARYYDQSAGRFTQMDTWSGEGAIPRTQNKYIYGYSEPTNFIDPSGNIGVGAFFSSAGTALTLGSVGYTAYDLTSLAIRGGDNLTPTAVGASLILGLVGNKVLKPIAKACKAKRGADDRCRYAIAYVEAQFKMHRLVDGTPNSRFDSKKSGTFTVRVVSPVMDIKRGRGTAAFNGPINSVIKSRKLKSHARKFGIYIGEKGACGTRNTVGRCAEWRAANKLLKSGSKIKNLRWLPAWSLKKGANGFLELDAIKQPCGICNTVNFKP